MTAVNASRAAALESGAKRYVGAVCSKHPELSGERNVRSRACIGCAKEAMRARRAANPEYHRRATRAAHEKWYPKNKDKVAAKHRERRTGIDQATYDALLKIQGGCCGVCGRFLAVAKPHADHCHDTGRPRGILCGTCNQAEGLIKASGLSAYEFGLKLADYLSHPPARKLDQ